MKKAVEIPFEEYFVLAKPQSKNNIIKIFKHELSKTTNSEVLRLALGYEETQIYPQAA
jgi:hypothetical protein